MLVSVWFYVVLVPTGVQKRLSGTTGMELQSIVSAS